MSTAIRNAVHGRRHCMIVYGHYPLSETRVQRQAESLVAAGYGVDVICLRGPGEPARGSHRGVEIHRVPLSLHKGSLVTQFGGYLLFLLLATARLTRLHLGARYRAVQVHNLPDFLVVAAWLPKLQGVPVILDLHDLMPEFFRGRFGDRWPLLTRLVRWQERMACRFADHVITVSDHWRETLIERGQDPVRCSVVMNLADEHIFAPQPGPGREADGEFRLLYHGTVTFRYGLDLAIRAVAALRDEIPGIRLTILGRGDAMSSLRQLRDELGLDGTVELRDEFIPAEDLPALIGDADLGVVPYRDDVFTDGLLPTKLMEFAAMGIPCVAARTTAIERYFRDSMVEFFEPGDVDGLARSIRSLHDDADLRSKLAQASERFTRRYNWATAATEYVELVERLGATSTTRPGLAA